MNSWGLTKTFQDIFTLKNNVYETLKSKMSRETFLFLSVIKYVEVPGSFQAKLMAQS